MLVADDDGDILLANPAAEELFQLPQFLLLQCNVRQLAGSPSERREQWEEFLRKGHQLSVLQLRTEEIVEYHAKADILPGHHLLLWRKASAEHPMKNTLDTSWATVAHELRSPLAAIRAAVDVLKHPTQANLQTSTKALETLDRQTHHLAKLLDALMDTSRAERGMLLLSKEEVELLPLLEHACETVMPLLEKKKQRLRRSVPLAGRVRLDVLKFTQVLVNLLQNASKFTPHEGLIELSAEIREEHVLVSVKDNGRGIPQPLLETIFEPFAQTQPSTDGELGGLGLGLHLARNWVLAHDGTLSAHSQGLGMGSEFRIRIPRGLPPNFPLASLQVLVVDDEPDARDLLTELLQFHGHRVHSVGNGHDGLETAKVLKPDVVFLDFRLSDMHGVDVVSHLRQHERQTGDVPCFVVGLTGEPSLNLHQEVLEAGCNILAPKPVAWEFLQKLLRHIAERKMERRETNESLSLPSPLSSIASSQSE